MATRTRDSAQLENDRSATASMVLSGMGHAEIAAKLGVSRQQIVYDMKVIRQRWQDNTTMDLTDAKSQELARIDQLERVYWDAWKLQCEDNQIATGDPALLAGILKCIERRCKLLGLDAPLQLEGKFMGFTIAFDTPNGPRSPEELEAIVPSHTNGKVLDL